MRSRLAPALRRAKNTWAALVVVLAGVVSALSAVANLTTWVSIAAAIAAVLGGVRVLIGELVVPLRMDAVEEATATIFKRPADSVLGYEVGTAFHVGGGRWITAAHIVDSAGVGGEVQLRLKRAVGTGKVTHIWPEQDFAVVEASQHWPWRVRTTRERPNSGDALKIVGWTRPKLGDRRPRRISIDLVAQGVLDNGAILLTGPHPPVGFSGAPAVDMRTGRVVGFVQSRVEGEFEHLNETHALPVAAWSIDQVS